MNQKMEITKRTSKLSHRLAQQIKQMPVESMSIDEIAFYVEAVINDKDPLCDICELPYSKATHFRNHKRVTGYLGCTICEDCLKKGLELLESDQ